jgi:DUF1009 family protein
VTTSSTEAGPGRKAIENGNGAMLGLVAGAGKLPGLLAKSAKEKGYRVISLCLCDEAVPRVEPHSEKTFQIAAGQLHRNLSILQSNSVKDMVFIGKVPKLEFLKNIAKFDWLAIRELSKLNDFNDDTIQFRMGSLLKEFDITVRSQAAFLTELFPDVGVMSKRKPSAQEYVDIQFGKRIAKEIARQDIGQTVVVRDQMIMAIEAIEGTDKAIRRAVELAKGPVVVVKVSKPNQDQRFDIPTVGLNTLNSMLGPKPGGVLAIEAHETMVVDKEEMIEFCEKHNLSMVAI